MTARCSKKRRKAFSRHQSMRAATRTGASHCRSQSRIAPAAASASITVRLMIRSSRASRRSILAKACRWSRRGGVELAFFESLPEHRREQVDLHLSRGLQFVRPCSSSRVPAPAAARHLISSCCRNCSATACRSRTRPAVPRSMAAISLRCHGAPVPTGAARPGTTAYSRTMPSSVLACVSRSTSRLR